VPTELLFRFWIDDGLNQTSVPRVGVCPFRGGGDAAPSLVSRLSRVLAVGTNVGMSLSVREIYNQCSDLVGLLAERVGFEPVGG
jgi:hypothetical protein